MASRKNQGKIDLNKASAEEIEQIEGIDSQRARLIVEHRDKEGSFDSWDDVEQVPGIGKTLLAKLQEGASVGGAKAGGKGRRQEAAEEAEGGEEAEEEMGAEAEGGEAEEVEEVEEQEEEDADLVALLALAEMDMGAAAAYEIGARCFEEEDESVSETLIEFQQDHLRHVENLERLAAAMGGEPIDREAAQESVLARLAEAAEALGPRAAILAMISNEQLTNSTYASILEIEWEDEVKTVLERNYEDEKRHLAWLEDNRDRFAAEQPEATA